MEKIIISGGKTLSGVIRISGSKNSALPIVAATLLSKNKIILKNIPNLSDLQSMLKLLESLNSTIVQTKEFVKIKSLFVKGIFFFASFIFLVVMIILYPFFNKNCDR